MVPLPPAHTFVSRFFIKFLSNSPNLSVPSVHSPGSSNGQDVAYSTTLKWSLFKCHLLSETSLTPAILYYSTCSISCMALVKSWCCHLTSLLVCLLFISSPRTRTISTENLVVLFKAIQLGEGGDAIEPRSL